MSIQNSTSANVQFEEIFTGGPLPLTNPTQEVIELSVALHCFLQCPPCHLIYRNEDTVSFPVTAFHCDIHDT